MLWSVALLGKAAVVFGLLVSQPLATFVLAKGILVERLGCGPAQAARQLAEKGLKAALEANALRRRSSKWLSDSRKTVPPNRFT